MFRRNSFLASFFNKGVVSLMTIGAVAPVLHAKGGKSRAVSMPKGMLPEAVSSFGGAVSGDWLYVYSGHTGEAHDHSVKNLSQQFLRLNLLDMTTWETLEMRRALQSPALVAHCEQLYRIGGMYASNGPEEKESLHSVDEVERFDPVAGTWTPLPPLPSPRSSHDAVVMGDKVYVVGGWRLDGGREGKEWYDSMLVMDLSAEPLAWQSVPGPKVKRRAVAAGQAKGKLYVIGGITETGGPSGDVDVFDPASGTWSSGPAFPGEGLHGFGASAFEVGGRLYASGAEGVIYGLNASGSGWERVCSLAFPRFFHRLLPAGDAGLLAVGGASVSGHVRMIERVELTPKASGPRSVAWTVPFPGQAKNRQGIFLHGDDLLVFGGNNSLEQHDFEPENFVREAYRLSLSRLQFSRASDFPAGRQSFVTTTIGGRRRAEGLAIGGFGHDGEVARSHDEIYTYSFAKNEWEKLDAKLPEPRTQFGLVEHNGVFWAFGGLDYDPTRPRKEHFRHVTDVLTWDRSASSGATFERAGIELLQPRRAFGGALIDDKYHLICGMRENFTLVETCDVFDFKTKTWSTIGSPSAPRISPEVVALNGKLYMAGGTSPKGEGEFEANTTLEVYDPATQKWSVVMETLPIPTRQMRMFALRDRLLLYSAQTEGTNAVRLAIIDP